MSTARTGPGMHAPPVRLAVVDLDPVLAQARDRHLDVRERRHRLADVAARRRPRRSGPRPAAAPRRTGSRRRRRSSPVRRAPRRGPTTSNGSVPRPSSSTRTPTRAGRSGPRPSDASGRAGRRRSARSRCSARPPAARSASRCRPVRSRPCAAASNGPGVTCQSSPVGVDRRAERRERSRHQLRVTRAQRPSYDGGAVGEGSEHERTVGQRLRAGQRDASPAPASGRAAPARGRLLFRVHEERLARPLRAIAVPWRSFSRSTSRPAAPRAWHRGRAASPRASRPWPRGGHARPRRACPRCRRPRASARRASRRS